MAIPCMDNSLLLINCDKIEELVLLDEACDSPVDMDWDSTVSEGEIPAVVYEAFDDYMTYKGVGDTPSHYGLSALLVGAIDHIIDICKIDSEASLLDWIPPLLCSRTVEFSTSLCLAMSRTL